jgi:hypothetical protein
MIGSEPLLKIGCPAQVAAKPNVACCPYLYAEYYF